MRIIANDYEASDIIRILRGWTGKTQEEFGRDIGLSRMTIQGYERKQNRYFFETLMKIAKIYGFKIIIEKKG